MTVVFNFIRNSWTLALGTALQTYKDLGLEDTLYLDKDGKIIGGDWISKKNLDFLWMVSPTKKFSGIFTKLKLLLEP